MRCAARILPRPNFVSTYVNDQPPVTNLSATLFVDDTLLMISDKNSKR